MNPTIVDISYAAAILDGEGCIHMTLAKTKGRSKNTAHKVYYTYCGLIIVEMCHPAVPLWLSKLFGGRTVYRKRVNTWRWYALADTAVAFLQSVLPHLKVKTPQAKLFLKYRKIVDKEGKRGPAGMSPITRDKLEEIRQQLAKAKVESYSCPQV